MEIIDLNVVIPTPKRVYEKISNELRERIINSFNKGFRVKDIGLMFKVNPKTVSKICQTYVKTNVIHKRKGGHRRPKLNDIQKDQIMDWIEENCTLSLKQIRDKLLDRYPDIQRISLETLNKVFKEFHYSFKRVTLVPERRNTTEVIESRFRYAVLYNQMMINKNKVFFVDETGVQVHSRRRYGRSPVGDKVHKTVAAIRGRNYSVCAVMREDSLYMFEIQDKAYNSEDFTSFLAKLFVYLINDGITGALLVMDNVRFHKTDEVLNLIQSHGHNAVFLPPYSPFLNPIEEVFNQWKGLVKAKECSTEDELYDAVHNTSDEITAQNCLNYVKHMESYLYKFLNKEVIES